MTSSLTLPLADLADGTPTRVEVDGHPVCLVRVREEVLAVDDTCTHAEVSLSEGEFEVTRDGAPAVECWLHGSRFDLRTGEPCGPPAITPVAVHTAAVAAGTVTVTLGPPDPLGALDPSHERTAP